MADETMFQNEPIEDEDQGHPATERQTEPPKKDLSSVNSQNEDHRPGDQVEWTSEITGRQETFQVPKGPEVARALGGKLPDQEGNVDIDILDDRFLRLLVNNSTLTQDDLESMKYNELYEVAAAFFGFCTGNT